MSSPAAEAHRQRHLLAAVRGDAGAASAAGLRAPAASGLAAYIANAQALAARALQAACPQVAAMLGEPGFAAAAWALWLVDPPQRGDMAAWGDGFPRWLEAQPALAQWPWLADAARLDLALHHAEHAADADLDAASLQRLGDADPARLRLRLLPGTVLVESPWPLATLHAAHRPSTSAEEREAALNGVPAAIAAGQGESVLVARRGWRAVPHRVAAADLPWLRAVLGGANLDAALAAAGTDFDFGAWLARALNAQFLQGVTVDAD